jgi:DNA polymerase III subunit epsilon
MELDRPVATGQFVVLDTELTGLKPGKDEILSIGAVRVRNLQIVLDECYYSKIRPARAIAPGSTLIHRITQQAVEDAPHFDTVIPDFVGFCGSAILVGHFMTLDFAFIDRSSRRLMGGIMGNPRVDSMQLARFHNRRKNQNGGRGRGSSDSLHLSVLTAKYGLPSFPQHHAFLDALQTAYLFIFLARKLDGYGIRTLADLLRIGAPGWNVFR